MSLLPAGCKMGTLFFTPHAQRETGSHSRESRHPSKRISREAITPWCVVIIQLSRPKAKTDQRREVSRPAKRGRRAAAPYCMSACVPIIQFVYFRYIFSFLLYRSRSQKSFEVLLFSALALILLSRPQSKTKKVNGQPVPHFLSFFDVVLLVFGSPCGNRQNPYP